MSSVGGKSSNASRRSSLRNTISGQPLVDVPAWPSPQGSMLLPSQGSGTSYFSGLSLSRENRAVSMDISDEERDKAASSMSTSSFSGEYEAREGDRAPGDTLPDTPATTGITDRNDSFDFFHGSTMDESFLASDIKSRHFRRLLSHETMSTTTGQGGDTSSTPSGRLDLADLSELERPPGVRQVRPSTYALPPLSPTRAPPQPTPPSQPSTSQRFEGTIDSVVEPTTSGVFTNARRVVDILDSGPRNLRSTDIFTDSTGVSSQLLDASSPGFSFAIDRNAPPLPAPSPSTAESTNAPRELNLNRMLKTVEADTEYAQPAFSTGELPASSSAVTDWESVNTPGTITPAVTPKWPSVAFSTESEGMVGMLTDSTASAAMAPPQYGTPTSSQPTGSSGEDFSVTFWGPGFSSDRAASSTGRPVAEGSQRWHARSSLSTPTRVTQRLPPVSEPSESDVWSTAAADGQRHPPPELFRTLRAPFLYVLMLAVSSLLYVLPLVGLARLSEWKLFGFLAVTGLAVAWRLVFSHSSFFAACSGRAFRTVYRDEFLARRLHLVNTRLIPGVGHVMIACWVMICVIASSVVLAIMFSRSKYGTDIHTNSNDAAGPFYNLTSLSALQQRAPNLKYPFCGRETSLGRLSLIDMAFLSSLAYEDVYQGGNPLKDLLASWFGFQPKRSTVPAAVLSNGTAAGVNGSSAMVAEEGGLAYITVTFPSYNMTVVSVRGTVSVLSLLEEFELWAPAAVMQLGRAFLPLGSWWDSLLPYAVDWLSPKSRDGRRAFSRIISHVGNVKRSLPSGHMLLLTGHSLGGGVAAIAGAQYNLPAVTFSAPGALLTHRRLGVHRGALNTYSMNVQPDHDLISEVGGASKLLQHIGCASRSLVGCHSLQRSMCEIVDACGTQARPVMLHKCAELGYEWAREALQTGAGQLVYEQLQRN